MYLKFYFILYELLYLSHNFSPKQNYIIKKKGNCWQFVNSKEGETNEYFFRD